jgi:hypothetical protein
MSVTDDVIDCFEIQTSFHGHDIKSETRVVWWQGYSRWDTGGYVLLPLLFLYLALIEIFISCGFTLQIVLLGYSENVSICGYSEFDYRQEYDFILSLPHPGRVWDDPNRYRLNFFWFCFVVYFTVPTVSQTTDHCFEQYDSWTKAEICSDNKEKMRREY